MKKLLYLRSRLVIFLIFGTSICAFGQNNTAYLLDSTSSIVIMSGTPGGPTDLGKSKYFYDSKNRISKIRSWSSGSVPTPYYYYYYYNNEKLASIESIDNNEVTFRATVSYNAQGLTSDSVLQNTYNNLPLKNSTKYSYEYNESGKKAVDTKFLWLNDVWVPNTRNSYSYDTEGRISESINEIASDSGIALYSKYIYKYNDYNKVIETQIFMYEAGSWNLYQTIKNTYNEAMLVLSEEYHGSSLFKADSLFYKDGKIDMEKQYSVSNGTYNLMTSSKYYYDNNKQLSLLERVEATLEGSLTYRTYYQYIHAPLDVNDFPETLFQISPNPAYDQITISLSSINPMLKHGVDSATEITIYNTLGERVTTPSLLGNDTPPKDGNIRINISNLPKGMYFVKIGTETAKFVKM